jgi:hypothetical protein
MIQNLKRNTVLVVAMILSCSTFAQVKFEKVYGSTGYDYGYSVTQMYDTGYAIVGTTTSFGSGSSDMYLLRTNSLGVPIGQKTFGGINIDQAYSVKSTIDSGLVIAGYTNSFGFGGYDMYVIKTDKNCDTIWTKTYGGTNWDFAYSIEQTADSGYIIAGGTYSIGNGSEDMYLVKTTSAGDTLWTKTFGGPNDDEAKSVKQTSDGGYILTGFSKSFGDLNGDIFVVKTDNMGNMLWTYKYQGLLDDFSYDVLEDNTGAGYIIGGETKSFALGFQGIIIRLNTSGSLIVASTIYGASANDGINAITQTADGRFATMGYTFSYGAGASDFAFYLENPIGTFNRSLTYGGMMVDKGYCIKNTFDGGFIICGSALSFSTFEHIYLIKTDSLGVSSGTVVNVLTGISSSYSNSSNDINVFPNPANDAFSIIINEKIKSDFIVTISDILGKTVCSKSLDARSVNEPILFNTEQFQTGVYLINIFAENYSANEKLIIHK